MDVLGGAGGIWEKGEGGWVGWCCVSIGAHTNGKAQHSEVRPVLLRHSCLQLFPEARWARRCLEDVLPQQRLFHAATTDTQAA